MTKATARPERNFTHRVQTGGHELIVDEPVDQGGDDRGPAPQELLAASLAACTAITIEMYAQRKGWDLGELEVECDYEQGERGALTEFKITLRLSPELTADQLDRLSTIAAKCPVHRTLEGPITITQTVATTARP